MGLKTALVREKFFIIVIVLVVEGGMSLNIEDKDEIKGITPGNDQFIMVSDGRGPHNANPSFFLSKKNTFFNRSLIDEKVTANPIAIPMISTKGQDLVESSERASTSKTSKSKLIIPSEGGVVRITRPTSFHERFRRYSKPTTGGGVVTTKVHSKTVIIPDEGGPVFIDLPDYVKYGPTKMKKTETPKDGLMTVEIRATPSVSSSVTSKDSADIPVPVQIPGEGSVVSGSGDSVASVGSGNSTLVSTDETSAITSQQPVTSIYIGSENYPFFAAIHSRGNGDASFDDVVCSGGILSETVVVTSCSCMYGDDWPAPPYRHYYVTAGHHKFTNIKSTPMYDVLSVKYHPSCEKKTTGLWQGNIAMLSIIRPGIKFSKVVRPMNLPKLKMWDASDILAKMSDQQRHCRVIGWSRRAPLIDTAIGKLIPLDECANPVCKKNIPCPRRTTIDGFMVEISASEPALLPGALLYCSEHVFAIVNTKRQCPTNNVFAACSPEELLYSKFNFEFTPEAQEDLSKYNNTFSKSIEGWETYSYPPTVEKTKTLAGLNTNMTKQEIMARIVSSGSTLFPFYISRETSWIYTYIFAAGYHFFVFNQYFNIFS